ncbi:hypothetical protein QJQ45_018970 [Haematococcus lacustris]|nr:hypothetical protein QJQ45_018970 [Haematococcus lacustris]
MKLGVGHQAQGHGRPLPLRPHTSLTCALPGCPRGVQQQHVPQQSPRREQRQPVRLLRCMASNPAAEPPAGKGKVALVPMSEVEELCTRALKTFGYNDSEAAVLLKVVLYAQLRDNSQGIVKITSGGLKKHAKAAPPVVEKETRLSAVINGNNTAGMLVLEQATQMAIARAKDQGFGIVGTNHTSTSTGALGYFAELVGKAGLIGLVLAQSPEFVAPHGARQAILGTNPIAISVPAAASGASAVPHNSPQALSSSSSSSNGSSGGQDGGEGHCVTLDMATSAFAWFGLLEAQTAGRAIPPDVAMDAAGQPTTNPSEVLSGGALRSFDRGTKGSGLGIMVELLAGPLVGAAVSDKLQEANWGNLVVAVDPALLGDPQVIKLRVRAVLDRVKGAARLPGVEEILLPGERGDRRTAAHRAAGAISLEANMLAELRALAAKLGQPGSPGKGARPAGRLAIATQLIHGTGAGGSVTDPYGASGPPLWQTATFAQPSATTFGPYDYTRSGNPTRTMLEEAMAGLEGADRSFVFTSGMAALAVVCKLVHSGEHIIAGDDIYGGTSRLLSQVVPTAGVSVTNVDMCDLEAVRRAVVPGRTKLIMVESPTNPRMQICDIAALAALAHSVGALCCVDNSIMAPVGQRPLDLGAHISMTSGTKFIGGHGDVTLGILSVKGEDLAKRVYFLQNAEGGGLAPFDCWLALRGLKTMALRMERSAYNCARLAAYLAAHPLVKKVNYAGLPSHPGHELHMRQASDGGCLLSFETGNVEASKIIVEETQLFKITVSFGNVASLISLPCYMSHASIPAAVRAARGLPDDLVRISAGIEDIEDLLADLDQAMNKAMATVGVQPPQPPPRGPAPPASNPPLPPSATASSSQGVALGAISNGNGVHTPMSHTHASSAMANGGAQPGIASESDRETQLVARIRHLESLLVGL